MTIYILNGEKGYGKKFVELCEGLQLRRAATPAFLLKNGFTNHHKPNLYFMRMLSGPKGYNVSFGITIEISNMSIKNIDLLNEDFLQPHMCNESDYRQVEKIVAGLIKKGILERK